MPVKTRTRQNGRGADQDLPAAISRPSPSATSTLGVDRLDRVPWPRLRPAVRVLDGALRDALCAAIHRGTNHVVGRITHVDALGAPRVLGMGRTHALTGVQCHWEATRLRRDLPSGQDTTHEFRRGQQPTRTEGNPGEARVSGVPNWAEAHRTTASRDFPCPKSLAVEAFRKPAREP
jgi:hypothetical protein